MLDLEKIHWQKTEDYHLLGKCLQTGAGTECAQRQPHALAAAAARMTSKRTNQIPTTLPEGKPDHTSKTGGKDKLALIDDAAARRKKRTTNAPDAVQTEVPHRFETEMFG